MNEDEEKRILLVQCLDKIIEGQWQSTQALLKIRQILETKNGTTSEPPAE